jgi:formylmethanofuran dehydrogenase subunit E
MKNNDKARMEGYVPYTEETVIEVKCSKCGKMIRVSQLAGKTTCGVCLAKALSKIFNFTI